MNITGKIVKGSNKDKKIVEIYSGDHLIGRYDEDGIVEKFGRGQIVGMKNKEVVQCFAGGIAVKDILYTQKNTNFVYGDVIGKFEFIFTTEQSYRSIIFMNYGKKEIMATKSDFAKNFNLDYCGCVAVKKINGKDFLDFGCGGISVETIVNHYFPQKSIPMERLKNILEREIDNSVAVERIELPEFSEIIAWKYEEILIYFTVSGKIHVIEDPEEYVSHPEIEKDDYLISKLISVEKKNRAGKIHMIRKHGDNVISVVSPAGKIVDLNVTDAIYSIRRGKFITLLYPQGPIVIHEH